MENLFKFAIEYLKAIEGESKTMGKNKIESIKVLNIAQPYAHYVFHSGKNIENRTMATSLRGTIAIYASKTFNAERFEDSDVSKDECDFGVILGFVDLVDCITEKDASGALEEWFNGPYGYVLENPRLLKKPIPVSPPKGAITWWNLSGAEVDKCLSQIRLGSYKEVYKTENKVEKLTGKRAPRIKLIPSADLAEIIGSDPISFKNAVLKIAEYAEDQDLDYDENSMILKLDERLKKLCKKSKVKLDELAQVLEDNLDFQ